MHEDLLKKLLVCFPIYLLINLYAYGKDLIFLQQHANMRWGQQERVYYL
jgi:hypothetical protein